MDTILNRRNVVASTPGIPLLIRALQGESATPAPSEADVVMYGVDASNSGWQPEGVFDDGWSVKSTYFDGTLGLPDPHSLLANDQLLAVTVGIQRPEVRVFDLLAGQEIATLEGMERPTAIVDNVVAASSLPGTAGLNQVALVAYDTADDAREIWRVEMPVIMSRVAIQGDRLFVATYNGVDCVDLSDGTSAWRTDIGQDDSGDSIAVSERIAVTTRVKRGRIVFGLDPETGTKKWEKELADPSMSEPVIVGEEVIVVGAARLTCLDVESGEETRVIEHGQEVDDRLFVVTNGEVLIANRWKWMTGFDVAGGNELWSGSDAGGYFLDTRILGSTVVTAATAGDASPPGELEARDVGTGEVTSSFSCTDENGEQIEMATWNVAGDRLIVRGIDAITVYRR